MKTAFFYKIFLLLFIAWGPLLIQAQDVEENKRFVKVASSSDDAVIVDNTDIFEAKPLCRLLQNQSVTVTDSTDGEYVLIIATCDGKKVTGWVKKIILGKKPIENNPRVSESGAVDNASLAANGSIGYGIDTTGINKKDIEEPWRSIDLTGTEAKLVSADLPYWDSDLIIPLATVSVASIAVVLAIPKNENSDPSFFAEDTSMVDTGTVDTNFIDCNLTISTQLLNADCGFSNGSIITTIDPPANYSYQWSDGSADQNLNNAAAGPYSLVVTDSLQQCSTSFNISLGEDPPFYLSELQVTPAICPDAGSISFDLQAPDGGVLDLHVEINGSTFDFIAPSGPVFLNDYMPIGSGDYLISASAANAVGDCVQSIQITVEALSTVIVDINSVINPSSPSANDGAIFGTVLSPVPPPFELFVNGLPMIIDDVAFAIENLGLGSYSIYAIASNGCASDTVIILFELPPELGKGFSFSIRVYPDLSQRIVELPGAIGYENKVAYNLWLEWQSGAKSYHPTFSLGYSPQSFYQDQNSASWEINARIHKKFMLNPFNFDFSGGPFIHLSPMKADKTLITSEDYGLVLMSSFGYDFYKGELPVSYTISIFAEAKAYATASSIYPVCSIGIAGKLK